MREEPENNVKILKSPYISISLNVNSLNSLIKRQSGWVDKKARPDCMLPTGDTLQL